MAGSDEDEEEIESDSDTADVNAAKSAGEGEHSDIHKEPVQGETMDWEALDLGKAHCGMQRNSSLLMSLRRIFFRKRQ